jgi:anthranilate phosphoribosyltransferase
MIKEAIKLLTEGHDLSEEQAGSAMTEIMTGQATNAQIASYLTALRIKGETVEEIAASAKAMREVSLSNDIPSDSMDIVGTGGDNSNSFNISTCSSFVVAAGGVKVAKHGNRSVSSKCGAADVLTELGAFLKTTPEQAKEVFLSCGFVFLHAQVYHPAMRFAAPVRGELGIRTVFNVLGPLGNPARAEMELLGVYSKEMVKPLAEVLAKLGTKRLIAVHGEDGLDEVSPAGKTYCVEVFDGKEREYSLTPADFGLECHKKEEILGGDPATNAAILRDVLVGKKGAYRDAVVMNSGLCFYIAGKANTPSAGARLAEKLIDDGTALATLEKYIGATNKFRV